MTIQNGNGTNGTLSSKHVHVDGRRFELIGPGVHYAFHVDDCDELVHDHFGSPAPGIGTRSCVGEEGWGLALSHVPREFPDAGRGDFRLPAIHIKHGEGHTVSAFEYIGFDIIPGKGALPGLPSTFGSTADVTTLEIHLEDREASLSAVLRYSIFPEHNAIARSFTLTNNGSSTVELQRAASLSIDLEGRDWDMTQLSGDWGRECTQSRRPVHVGSQGFQSSTGFSSHYFNPFVALLSPTTTDDSGIAYGLSLIYSGSFAVDVERFASNSVRAMIGLNPLHLSWPIAPGHSFTSPEAVAVFSTQGLGGMSRSFHNLYRSHLSRSSWTRRPRPVLLNAWEGMYFDFDAEIMYQRALEGASLGAKLFVMDDGWFGDKYPRVDERAGLGDWVVNPKRFPDGLNKFVKQVNEINVQRSQGEKGTQQLQFGIWVEPEMVNPASELYQAHPDWVLHAGKRNRTTRRYQLVLDLSKHQVQDYIIDAITALLQSANITYVKWDNNRGMHEIPSPATAHSYILGLYRVIDTLTTRFPDVLFEGCASGGGRFDPGLLHYWPQSWTSDNTDALERLHIQFGTSLVYPPSAMGCHISVCPNEQLGRTTPLSFRAHVAMMGGSFGLELEIDKLSAAEKEEIGPIIALAETVNPVVVNGHQYRLAHPAESNWPAVMYVSPDRGLAVLVAFQMAAKVLTDIPTLRFQGLDTDATYIVDGVKYSGALLVNVGLKMKWDWKDYQSQVLMISRI